MPWRQQFDLAFALALTAFASLAVGADGFTLLCLLLACGGMALFCQRRSGRLGALIAGLVYACNPLLLATISDGRELLALALLPLALWRLDALRDRPLSVNFSLAVLAQALFVAAHASAVWLGALAALWIAGETLIQHLNRESSRLRAGAGLMALLAMLLGILAALPFLHIPPPIGMESPTLGAAQWTLALAGALGGMALYLRGYRTRHPNTLLGAAVCAAAALALLAAGLNLAAIALCLAYLASLNGLWLERLPLRIQASSIALVVALPVISILPLQSVDSPPGGTNSLEMLLALDATIVISFAAILAAVAMSLRLGQLVLAPRLYWKTPPLTRAAVIGALAGAALAVCVWLILP